MRKKPTKAEFATFWELVEQKRTIPPSNFTKPKQQDPLCEQFENSFRRENHVADKTR